MSRLIVCLLTLAVFLLVVPTVFAQRERDTYTGNSLTFEVNGEVRLGDSGVSAVNVPVRLERFSGGLIDQIVTDNRGRFRFPNLQRGYYKIIVNAPGYVPAQQDADLQVTDADLSGSRRLVLTHRVRNGVLLDKTEAERTLQYLSQLWGYRVKLLEQDMENGRVLKEHEALPMP